MSCVGRFFSGGNSLKTGSSTGLTWAKASFLASICLRIPDTTLETGLKYAASSRCSSGVRCGPSFARIAFTAPGSSRTGGGWVVTDTLNFPKAWRRYEEEWSMVTRNT